MDKFDARQHKVALINDGVAVCQYVARKQWR